MQYKIDFVMGIMSFLLNQLTSIIFITIVFQGITEMGDWSYYEIILLYGFSLIPKGIDHFFTDNLWNLSSSIIKDGSFDRYLLRPLSPLYHIVVETTQFDALGELITGILASNIAMVQLNLKLSFLDVSVLFFSIIIGSVIYTCIKVICAAISFWKGKSGNILKVVYMLSDFNKYPISIYNIVIRNLLTYIIPFAFTAYIPIKYFLGKTTIDMVLISSLIAVFLIMSISVTIWKLGIKRYEGSGH